MYWYIIWICDIYIYNEYLHKSHKSVWWMVQIGYQYAAWRSGWASWTFGGTASASTLLGPAALEQLWGWTSGCAGTKIFRLENLGRHIDHIWSYCQFAHMDVCLVCLQVSIFWKFYSNVRLVRRLEWLAEQCWRHAVFQGEARKYDALWCGCALAEIYITPCGTLEDSGSPETTFADSVV